MVLDPAVINDVQQVLRDADAFYVEAHQVIYQALVAHYDAHQAGDVTLLLEALRGRDALEPVGGVSYIERLISAAPAPTNALHYARVVQEQHRLRRLAEAAGAILYDAYHMGEGEADTLPAIIDRAERLVFEVAEESLSSVAERLSELLHQTMETLDANEGRTITGVATGYLDLDEITSGLQPGELIIVAARPSMGKTALALNMAEQIALAGGPGSSPTPALFFSLEMSRQAVAQRVLCARSGVDSQKLRRNMLSDSDYQRLMATCGELDSAPLLIDDTPGMTVTQLRARARRAFTQHHVGCVFVDYLQLLTAPGASRESRQVEVSAISRGIKALARELNVPIVCLSQLNRSAEQREGHRPRMSDLRESGSIEQDADVIMLLHRESYYHQRDSEWSRENAERENLAELIIAKQRNGPTGVIELEWDRSSTRFHPREWKPTVSNAPAAAPAPAGAFGSRPPTGPAANHRDGGGPETPNWDKDIAAPF